MPVSGCAWTAITVTLNPDRLQASCLEGEGREGVVIDWSCGGGGGGEGRSDCKDNLDRPAK